MRSSSICRSIKVGPASSTLLTPDETDKLYAIMARAAQVVRVQQKKLEVDRGKARETTMDDLSLIAMIALGGYCYCAGYSRGSHSTGWSRGYKTGHRDGYRAGCRDVDACYSASLERLQEETGLALLANPGYP